MNCFLRYDKRKEISKEKREIVIFGILWQVQKEVKKIVDFL